MSMAKLVDFVYRGAVRPLLFQMDAEKVHDRVVRVAERACGPSVAQRLMREVFAPSYPSLELSVAGLRFQHPLGLAAGFDKNGRAIPFWSSLGFSHIEIGSISADPSLGNPKPRLFRIPLDRGIVVNYGLPNDGAGAVAQRLAGLDFPVPLGINLVNTNRGAGAVCESEDAIIEDYVRSVRTLQGLASYLVLNLSCPNTPDGRSFITHPGRLRRLLSAMEGEGIVKPLFVKVAPFPDANAMNVFLETVCTASCVTGFAINLPPGKPAGLCTPPEALKTMPGAVAGKPVETLINRTLAALYLRVDPKRYRIIAAGGVFTAEDAYRKIRLGATLVQLLTGMIYRGPGIVREICTGLVALLERDGFRNIEEAIGVDAANPPLPAAGGSSGGVDHRHENAGLGQ